MTLLHLLYAVAVGALLTGAAACVEGALRGSGRAARGVWVVALLATVSAPWWGPQLARMEPAVAGTVALEGEAPLTAAAAAAPSAWSIALRTPRPVLGWVWLVGGMMGVAVVSVGLARLEVRSRRWPTARMEGEEVAVSSDFGPALVGLRRPRTVLPRWAFTLAEREIALILEHERSHRRAGDGATLAAALLVAAACPWNPMVWLQFRKLRDAVEMDCDRRVLARGVSRPAYARVLVLVRLRAAESGVATAALVESGSSLERRLKTMRAFPWTRRRTVVSGLAAGALVALACETPAPSAVEVDESRTTVVEVEVPLVQTLHEGSEPLEEIVVTGRPGNALIEVREIPATEPLIVVDGVIMRGGMETVQELVPDEIERIQVTKGEAARARFGERAAAGVVEIETKKAPPSEPVVVEGRAEPRGVIRLREIPPPPPAPEVEKEAGYTAVFIYEGDEPEVESVKEAPLEVEVPLLRLRDRGN
ncbi:M56 family metallopeptidase [Gaopeijia maritima]|uniref:M56 family metallopeptidase n=1 Tax=Gaopeijia maritima TaxID=3119007 RepID=UPI00328D118E